MPINEKLRVRRSIRQEKRIARTIASSSRVAGSGSQPGNKGDVRLGKHWLCEAKFTDAVSYSLKLKTWQKIEMEAYKAKRMPVMIINIAGKEFAVVDRGTFEDIVKIYPPEGV